MDTAGTVYVNDLDNNRVLALADGSTSQEVLPFTGLNRPWGVAVDDTRTVFVADTSNNRVLKQSAVRHRPGQPGADAGGRVEYPHRAAIHRP